MFIGHFALGLASKKLEPEVSLATSFLAAQLADAIWPVLVLAGVERVTIAPGDTVVAPLRFDSYPWSHSLLMLLLWAAAFAGIHFAVKRRGRAALVLGGLVVSHWVLDFVSHRADMPLTPWTPERVGLGLWNSLPATVVVEGLLFVAGASMALAATRPRDAIGRWGLLSVLALLVLAYLANLAGPPPPSVAALAWTGIAAPVILLPVVAWVDRHRRPA
jgi:LexA-binding, inner membrane-associated putative hydrolase